MPPSPSALRTEHLPGLLARWRQGDAAAADELILRVTPRLETLARQMLRRYPVVRGQAQTADVMQEAALRLLNALRSVTPEDTTHFFNLAGRHLRFHLLDLARQFRQGVPLPLHEQPDPPALGTRQQDVDDLDWWQAFHQAVEGLPDEERQVVDLRFYQGLPFTEIAGVLHVNERTARRHWQSAAVILAETLGGQIPAPEGGAEAND